MNQIHPFDVITLSTDSSLSYCRWTHTTGAAHCDFPLWPGYHYRAPITVSTSRLNTVHMTQIFDHFPRPILPVLRPKHDVAQTCCVCRGLYASVGCNLSSPSRVSTARYSSSGSTVPPYLLISLEASRTYASTTCWPKRDDYYVWVSIFSLAAHEYEQSNNKKNVSGNLIPSWRDKQTIK